METNKSLNEAIFRAYPATEKINQSQHKLSSMGSPDDASYTSNTHQAPLNESHVNLMQSWMNLRDMDNELAETKFSDMNGKQEA